MKIILPGPEWKIRVIDGNLLLSNVSENLILDREHIPYQEWARQASIKQLAGIAKYDSDGWITVTKQYSVKFEREFNYFGIRYVDGRQCLFKDGLPHRDNGPAIITADGDSCWKQYGKIHREDGPAVKLFNGSEYWHINGERLTEDKFNKWRIKNEN